MQPIEMLVLMNYLFRFGCALIGLVAMYLGFRLYLAVNAPGSAGDLEAGWEEVKIKVTRGAPGTIMVIAGAFIAAVSVWRGASFKAEPGANGTNYTAAAMTAIDTTSWGRLKGDSALQRALDSARRADCRHSRAVAESTKAGGKADARRTDSVVARCADEHVMVK